MISAFGIDHDLVAKSALGEAYKVGRSERAWLEGAKKDLGPAYREHKKVMGAFGNKPGEPQTPLGQRAAFHVGFHRNAYLGGVAAAKESAAVGAGVTAYQQRKKRKAAGQPATAPVIEALAKRWQR